jgi:Na+-translocating ferredoxin:NAD+ oxidoreductase RnfG subunit
MILNICKSEGSPASEEIMKKALVFSIAASALHLPAYAAHYMTVEQAQKQLYPEADRFEDRTLRLSEAEKAEVEKRSGVNVRLLEQKVWRAWKGQEFLGYFILDEVYGKHEFITYSVALTRQGKVQQIEILDYRESYGGEVRNPAWLKQFYGKDNNATLQLNRDVINISGATLSCKHVTDGVRRLLATFAVKGHEA